MPYIGRAPTSTATKLEDADQDTKIQVEESSDEDIIRFDIAGAEDFTMTANTLNVLSGSTVNIASGATIANNGTATGFDPAIAASGIMEANANFVDAVIFGPAMDPVDWSGRTAANTASLMLATVEDTGADAQVNVWDLTSTTIASATPLATLNITGAATVTSVAASMGYIIVGSEDGTTIIDPHSGAWAERTTGWPRSLSTSTTPALFNNDVQAVAAGVHDDWPSDPRTGGTLPCFAVSYGTGTEVASLIKYDGNVFETINGTVSAGEGAVAFSKGVLLFLRSGSLQGSRLISTLTADDVDAYNLFVATGTPQGFGAGNGASASNSVVAAADPDGLSLALLGALPISGGFTESLTAMTTRAYNTGYMTYLTKGAWLANSKTVDRSYLANTLTENGTVTEAVVETGAELKGYSGFSASNNLTRASDADWDTLGTGAVTLMAWVKTSSSSAAKGIMGFGNAGYTDEVIMYIGSGVLKFLVDGAAGTIGALDGAAVTADEWHQFVCVQVSSTERHIYQDGVLTASSTTDTGSITDTGNMPLCIGAWPNGTDNPASTEEIALARISATAPTAAQVRQMYDAEKGMFVASAKCLLQGSTDAVLDVSVDPITGKVAVTQTDSQMIFDGLVVESTPAVNAGDPEHNLLYGGDRVEINSVNLYATIAAKNLRGDLDLVRGMKAGLPQAVDLGKAKAWVLFDGSGTAAILSSFNVKSFTDAGAGDYTINWGIPFKSTNSYTTAMTAESRNIYIVTQKAVSMQVGTVSLGTSTSADANLVCIVAFGELENE